VRVKVSRKEWHKLNLALEELIGSLGGLLHANTVFAELIHELNHRVGEFPKWFVVCLIDWGCIDTYAGVNTVRITACRCHGCPSAQAVSKHWEFVQALFVRKSDNVVRKNIIVHRVMMIRWHMIA
jgi:hypothetical protein